MLSTAFTELVGCAAPVQLAGTGVSSLELAVAVARAGGLGTVSAGYLGGPDRAARVLDGIGDVGPGALGVNILVCVPEHVELVEAVATRVRVVDCFWGDPSAALVDAAHRSGALVAWQIGSEQEARQAEDAGCDLIVAQGAEAGGHVRGVTPLFELLDVVLDRATVPVVASGGIGSARRLAAVLAAGAAGARVGTRFVSATESAAHPDYVKALADAEPDDSVATGAFDVGCPLCPSTHRVLRSSLEAATEAPGDQPIGAIESRDGSIPVMPFSFMPPTTRTSGNIGAMALYAGRSVGACRHGQSAQEILDELVDGAAELLASVRPAQRR
jgi:NAD(P)H-dependent flavin oxidoreductase YrpB (nitropropane dioxygenase family)